MNTNSARLPALPKLGSFTFGRLFQITIIKCDRLLNKKRIARVRKSMRLLWVIEALDGFLERLCDSKHNIATMAALCFKSMAVHGGRRGDTASRRDYQCGGDPSSPLPAGPFR